MSILCIERNYNIEHLQYQQATDHRCQLHQSAPTDNNYRTMASLGKEKPSAAAAKSQLSLMNVEMLSNGPWDFLFIDCSNDNIEVIFLFITMTLCFCCCIQMSECRLSCRPCPMRVGITFVKSSFIH